MEAPQIIVICLMFGGVVLHMVKHGEKKKGLVGEYHVGWHLFSLLITIALLWWGGFWN